MNNSVFLGLSINSKICNRDSLQGYIAWAGVNSKSFAILVGDYISAFTNHALSEKSFNHCEDIARNKGQELVRMLESLKKEAEINIKVITWFDLLLEPIYIRLLGEIECIYSESPEFRSDVRQQVIDSIGHRISENKKIRNENYVFSYLDKYVLHELVGLILMSEFLGFETEIYPGKDLKIMEKVYSEKYFHFNDLKIFSKNRKFINLRIN